MYGLQQVTQTATTRYFLNFFVSLQQSRHLARQRRAQQARRRSCREKRNRATTPARSRGDRKKALWGRLKEERGSLEARVSGLTKEGGRDPGHRDIRRTERRPEGFREHRRKPTRRTQSTNPTRFLQEEENTRPRLRKTATSIWDKKEGPRTTVDSRLGKEREDTGRRRSPKRPRRTFGPPRGG